MEIKKGDIVEVKKGLVEPDFGEFELSGWKGIVTDRYEFKGEHIIEISWNIETLNKMPKNFVKESVKEGYSFSEMHLGEKDVFKIGDGSDDKKERERLVIRLEQMYWSTGNDKQDDRIKTILENHDSSVNEENLNRYREYLQSNLKEGILLTGVEDFPWEERFVFGYGSKKQYESLRKEKPSFKDHFKLLKILQVEEGGQDLYVKVSRRSDMKEFEIQLSNLKSVDKNSNDYELLDDFSVWIVNY